MCLQPVIFEGAKVSSIDSPKISHTQPTSMQETAVFHNTDGYCTGVSVLDPYPTTLNIPFWR